MIRLSLLVKFLAEGYAENLYERFGTQYVLCHSTPRTFARHDFSALSTFAEVDSIKVLALEVIHLNSFCLIGMVHTACTRSISLFAQTSEAYGTFCLLMHFIVSRLVRRFHLDSMTQISDSDFI